MLCVCLFIVYYTALHCTLLYYTVSNQSLQRVTATPHSTLDNTLHNTALDYNALPYTVLHYTALHYTLLHCTALHYVYCNEPHCAALN